jgi:hypothetical protein
MFQLDKQNCWYFCFVIQRLLSRDGDGWFERGDKGETRFGDLAPDASSRIEARFAEVRDMPLPLTVSDALVNSLLKTGYSRFITTSSASG